MSELDQLVKMANQIAANFTYHDDAIERTADHLHRFWAPSMIRLLSAHVKQGGDGVTPTVVEALARIEASQSAA